MDKLCGPSACATRCVTGCATGCRAYGSCAGMILLADRVLDGRPDQQTLGGIDMTVRRNAFGRQVDSLRGGRAPRRDRRGPDPRRSSSGRPGWRRSVRDVEVLARVEDGPAEGRIVAVRQGSLLATSFHPEMTGDGRVHELFVDGRAKADREGSRHMSGHSKWATTKHKKAVIDAKRGKSFAKLIKNIEVAARTGGGDVGGNPTLYDAIQKAKKTSVPNDNIDRAVKRGSGAEAGGADYQTIMYEGYGPGGVAVLDRVPHRQPQPGRRRGAHRDDPQRRHRWPTPARCRYLFNRKGVVIVPKADGLSEDDVLAAVLDAGAEEVNDLGEAFEVVCEATDLVAVRTALQSRPASTTTRPTRRSCRSVSVPLDEDGAKKVFRLIEALEDCDDVQNVWANFDVSDEVMEAVG